VQHPKKPLRKEAISRAGVEVNKRITNVYR
jgi:hypothetical protein